MSEKIKFTVHFKNVWVDGGTSVATIGSRAIQNGSEVASTSVPYVAGPSVPVSYGAEVPNGDTRITARAHDGNGVPVGDEVFLDIHVDKVMVQVPSHITVE
jgi:hypothetical protein